MVFSASGGLSLESRFSGLEEAEKEVRLCDLFPFHILRRCGQATTLRLFFFSFLGPRPWHMEVPRLGVSSEL